MASRLTTETIMKKLSTLLFVALTALTLATITGCAHARKVGTSKHEIFVYGVVTPPNWKAVVPTGQYVLPLDSSFAYADYSFTAGETNTPSGLFANRPHIFLARHEIWEDYSAGGGTFLFTDPNASQIASAVSNQAGLAGSHAFTVGSITSTVTTNDVGAINAVGTAAGNVIGAAAKAAAGKP